MLLYDWQKIFTVSAGKPSTIFLIFEMLVKKSVPKNTFDPIYRFSDLNFTGDSFLAHPDVLLYNSFRHTRRDVALYMALASMRSLAEFLVNDKTTLDLLECPIDPFEHLEQPDDRLLYIEDDQLHFLYEEVPKEKIQWH